jgi:hypothetical protein
MDKAIADSLNRLRSVSPRLNEASDKLGKTISKVEQALAELNLGVDAWVSFPDTPNDLEAQHGLEWCEGLAYEKHGGHSWGIFYVSGISGDDPEGFSHKRLASAPREIRLRVVEHDLIPKLVKQLADDSEKKALNVEKAAKRCEFIAQTLQKS